MKNIIDWGAIALVVVFAFMIAACPDDVNVTIRNPLDGTITIDITSPRAGQTITATYSGNGTGSQTWQWYSGGTLIYGANSNVYLVKNEDIGKALTVSLTYSDQSGSISASTGTVAQAENVAVSSISGLPTTAYTGIPLVLSGTVMPVDATHKTITWSIENAGTTFAYINGNVLNTVAPGTIIVTATVANGNANGTSYNQNFAVTVGNFVPVTGISGFQTAAIVATPLNLSGTIAPGNSSDRTIVWSVLNPGTTGANINGNILNTTAGGTLTVRASVADGFTVGVPFNQDFNITVIQPVTNISGLPTVINVGIPLPLNVTIMPENASDKVIIWSVQSIGSTGVNINDNTLNTVSAGTLTLRATITNGLAVGSPYIQDFNITVIQPVTGISEIPVMAYTGIPFTLTGTVSPGNASYQTIVWTVKNAGSTGASINNNILSVYNGGTVTVTATIANGTAWGTAYTQDFDISVPDPNTGIVIGNTSVELYLNGSASALVEGESTIISQGDGTYNVSIAPGTYSEIIWYLNGNIVPQGTNNTSLVLTRRIAGTYQVTVEATMTGVKNTGNHSFKVE